MTKDAKQKRMEKAQRLRLERTKARADAYFIIYYDMGVERSLEKLGEHVHELGITKSTKTLARYSVQYNWQQRIIEEDTRRNDADLANADKRRSEMMTRQSKIGRTMQTLAVAGMLNLQDLMKNGRLDITPQEIAKLAKDGTDLELRAEGEPTHRIEITTILYNVLIARIAHVFKEINQLPTAEARESRFATLVDQQQVTAMEEVNALVEGKG